jgi:hypothetical protein
MNKTDYSKFNYTKRIARENIHLYSRLVKVYTSSSTWSPSCLANNSAKKSIRPARGRSPNSLNRAKQIHKENTRLVNTICNVKPDKFHSIDECSRLWLRHLNFKRNKLASQRVV